MNVRLTLLDTDVIVHDFEAILQRAHKTQGVVWWARRTHRIKYNIGYMVFIPRGWSSSSDYQDGISSTMVRQLFFDKNLTPEDFRAKARRLVPNPDLLAIYMGLDKRWTADMWDRISTLKIAHDDMALLAMINTRSGAAVKRRASFS